MGKSFGNSFPIHQRLKFINWIMSVEDKTFNWTSWPELREGVKAEVENLDVYGVNLDQEVYGQIPEKLPLSAPYLTQLPPFSHPAGAVSLNVLLEAEVHFWLWHSDLSSHHCPGNLCKRSKQQFKHVRTTALGYTRGCGTMGPRSGAWGASNWTHL